jgi:hypothetical protein
MSLSTWAIMAVAVVSALSHVVSIAIVLRLSRARARATHVSDLGTDQSLMLHPDRNDAEPLIVPERETSV